jgi:hypothetical protein
VIDAKTAIAARSGIGIAGVELFVTSQSVPTLELTRQRALRDGALLSSVPSEGNRELFLVVQTLVSMPSPSTVFFYPNLTSTAVVTLEGYSQELFRPVLLKVKIQTSTGFLDNLFFRLERLSTKPPNPESNG